MTFNLANAGGNDLEAKAVCNLHSIVDSLVGSQEIVKFKSAKLHISATKIAADKTKGFMLRFLYSFLQEGGVVTDPWENTAASIESIADSMIDVQHELTKVGNKITPELIFWDTSDDSAMFRGKTTVNLKKILNIIAGYRESIDDELSDIEGYLLGFCATDDDGSDISVECYLDMVYSKDQRQTFFPRK